MRVVACASLVLVVAATTASASPTRVSQSDPHPGIHREHWVDAALPARIELVRIDLTSAEIALYATKESDKGITTSAYASRKTAQVAINGDAFSVVGFTPRGLAIGEATPWTNTHDGPDEAMFHFARVGERTVAAIEVPEATQQPSDLPAATQGVISGRPLLLRAGAIASIDCNDAISIPCQAAPRSAIALSADGNTMWLVVVDGWQAGSAGMTADALAHFLLDRGGHFAIALDGGSSSAMSIDGELATLPSDGVERAVANHLAVKYGALPKGELVGLVCKQSVFQCANNAALKISGATVTLDDGRAQTTDATAFYDFTTVTPRLACVTVKKTGYHTKRQCQQVDPGSPTYNSVVLEPGMDAPIDAGVADAPGPDEMGGDGGFGLRDGGNPDPGGPGCCDAGRSRPPIALVLLVGWMLTRRRGTKA